MSNISFISAKIQLLHMYYGIIHIKKLWTIWNHPLLLKIRSRYLHETDPETDPGSKESAKIMEIYTKINQNHKNIIHFFQKH